MKTIMTLGLMLLSVQTIFSQNKTEKSLTYRLNFDTIMKPDYFNIEIMVAEYVKYEGKGRKSKSELVPLDSVSQHLIAELNRLGFNVGTKETAITEKNDSYGGRAYFTYSRPLFQVMHQLSITSRDSINYLFKEISKENMVSFIVTPKFNSLTLERAKEKLFVKGLNSIKDYAQKIADSNNIKIIKQSNIQLGFGPDRGNFNTNYNKQFQIDLSDVKYELTATYTYTYEDK